MPSSGPLAFCLIYFRPALCSLRRKVSGWPLIVSIGLVTIKRDRSVAFGSLLMLCYQGHRFNGLCVSFSYLFLVTWIECLANMNRTFRPTRYQLLVGKREHKSPGLWLSVFGWQT